MTWASLLTARWKKITGTVAMWWGHRQNGHLWVLGGDPACYLCFSMKQCFSWLASKKKNILLFKMHFTTTLEDDGRNRDVESGWLGLSPWDRIAQRASRQWVSCPSIHMTRPAAVHMGHLWNVLMFIVASLKLKVYNPWWSTIDLWSLVWSQGYSGLLLIK